MTHISAVPLELIMYIFKWVVSVDLDLKSLEQLARVSKMADVLSVALLCQFHVSKWTLKSVLSNTLKFLVRENPKRMCFRGIMNCSVINPTISDGMLNFLVVKFRGEVGNSCNE